MKIFENQLTDVPRKTYDARKYEGKFFAENKIPKFQHIMTLSLELQEGCLFIELL